MSKVNSKAMAAIHAAKRDLGMDEDTYRDMLFNVAGKRSAKDLDKEGVSKVLDHLRSIGATKIGAKKPGQYPGKPHNFDSMPAMIDKIEALLADMKLPWSYADSIAKRQTGVEKIAWVRDEKSLRAVISALAVEQEKRGLLASLEELLRRRGWTMEHFEDRYGHLLPKGWKRNRRTLKGLNQQFCIEDGDDYGNNEEATG